VVVGVLRQQYADMPVTVFYDTLIAQGELLPSEVSYAMLHRFLTSMVCWTGKRSRSFALAAGITGGKGGVAYTASKHGLVGLTRNVGYRRSMQCHYARRRDNQYCE
jgi:NAD(P)-dependent dehydrogenase (short-subunit alcohol dehydrogenase family)